METLSGGAGAGNSGLLDRIERLNALGIALSAERDPDRLLEGILLGAKELAGADAGTLYVVDEAGNLAFEIVRNDTLDIAMGGAGGEPVPFDPVPLKLADGTPNTGSVVAQAVLQGRTIHVEDAYASTDYDFTYTRAFDAKTGYRSVSFLTVPMRDHEGTIIGVLQLINARGADGRPLPFDDAARRLVESLASQAAVAMTQRRLIDGLRDLFDGLIRLVADAVDEKSPYTGGHCRRVTELTMMLADAAARTDSGSMADFTMNEPEREELRVAAWLHDCGKITTPEWVIDKRTKLEGIVDRIEIVAHRFGMLKQEARIRMWKGLADGADRESLERDLAETLEDLDADLAFLRKVNVGGEFMSDAHKERVRAIASRRWRDADGEDRPLLSEEEIAYLCIPKGTLSDRERKIIQNHVSVTIRMLEALPYPKHLRRVPALAGAHHERVDGKGYPKGLTRDAMPVGARAMAIADVFEALTAPDRPYKKPMRLSQALAILGKMKLEGHVDPDLFDVFIREGVWRDYAAAHMDPDQVDDVDVAALPGAPA